MNSHSLPPLLLYSPFCTYGLLENVNSTKSKLILTMPLFLSLINFTCSAVIRVFILNCPTFSSVAIHPSSLYISDFSPWPSFFFSEYRLYASFCFP